MQAAQGRTLPSAPLALSCSGVLVLLPVSSGRGATTPPLPPADTSHCRHRAAWHRPPVLRTDCGRVERRTNMGYAARRSKGLRTCAMNSARIALGAFGCRLKNDSRPNSGFDASDLARAARPPDAAASTSASRPAAAHAHSPTALPSFVTRVTSARPSDSRTRGTPSAAAHRPLVVRAMASQHNDEARVASYIRRPAAGALHHRNRRHDGSRTRRAW